MCQSERQTDRDRGGRARESKRQRHRERDGGEGGERERGRETGVDVNVGQHAVPVRIVRSDTEGIAQRFAAAIAEARVGWGVPGTAT